MSDQGTLCAFYDLGLFPTSYDIAVFLLAAQGIALERGLSSVRLLLVDGPHHGVRFEGPDYETLYPPAQRLWKVSHIMQAVPRLCPLVDRRTGIIGREDCRWYLSRHQHAIATGDYDGMYLRAWRALDRYRAQVGLRASMPARSYMQAWLAGNGWTAERPLVTITTRESQWSTPRNSELATWSSVALKLQAAGFWPVLVPDTERAFAPRARDEWGETVICPLASFDVELRMALYELAHINLVTPSGPAMLVIGSASCRYVYLVAGYEDTSESCLERVRTMGTLPGLMPFRPAESQRWLWGPTTVETVWRAFCALDADLNGRPFPSQPEWASAIDEAAYFAAYPEVASAVRAGKLHSAIDHYARFGQAEGRKLFLYPPLARAAASGPGPARTQKETRKGKKGVRQRR